MNAAITVEDYDLWKTHELDTLDPDHACPWRGGETLAREAVVLVPENAAAGKINGKQLASRAPLHGEPGSASAGRVVVRCEARHNEARGDRKGADDFRQVRQATHLCVGARVMLTQNHIWGVPTVSLGLMNGARGVVVAIVYAPLGAERTDGSTIAGTGYPSSTPGSYPRGQLACPLPDFVVVHFPQYKGPACFSRLPGTWVPIPCAEVRHKTLKSVTRAGVPLRLAWALTIHKSQGITAHEGCIVSFDACRASSSVGKLGLAFVAWTRAVYWSQMAFHKLPPLAEFISGRLSRDFQARCDFENKADAMFASLLARRGISPEALLAEHEKHLEAVTWAKERRKPSDMECADLRAMLGAVGVAPISDSVVNHCAQQSGRKAAGLWSFVAAFRAEKNKKPKKRTPQKVVGHSDRENAATQYELTTGAVSAAEDSALQLMIDMGFKEEDITRALEKSGFVFGRALLLLLNGLDAQRTKYDSMERFRRHGMKTCGGSTLRGWALTRSSPSTSNVRATSCNSK